MNKNLIHKRSVITQIAFIASYGAQFSFFVGFFIETVSALQTACLILRTSFPSSQDHNFFILNKIKDFLSYVSLFFNFNEFQTEFPIFLVWLICSIYLIGFSILMLSVTILCIKGKNVANWIKSLCTVTNLIHSKILSAPITFFYCSSIALRKQCGSDPKYSLLCEDPALGITSFFLVINLVLAYIKEMYFYQTYRSKNLFSVTNNIHAFLQLTHKVVLIPLLTLTNDMVLVNSILNIVFTLLYHESLFWKLPFYSIAYLKAAVLQSTISVSFSSILFWKSILEYENKNFEMIIFLLTPLFIKLMNIRINSIFQNILSLKATAVEKIVHLPGLMREYINQPTIAHAKGLYLKAFSKYGFVENSELAKQQKKIFILQHLLKCYKLHPKSANLLLFLVQFYVEQMMNVQEAIAYIQKAETQTLSPPKLNNLDQAIKQLQKLLLIRYSEDQDSLELINYFKYRNISITFKKAIENEISYHNEFWQMLSKTFIEVHKVIEVCHGLEEISHKIKTLWQVNEASFMKDFPLPIVLYVSYLSVIRGLPVMGRTILEKFIGKNSTLPKYFEKFFSQEKALLVVSNQKGQLGKVLDASHSVKNLFNIERDDLIGTKVNILMPNMIKDKHDDFIQKYNQRPVYNLDHKIQTYCRTTNGLFFTVKMRVKVYPYIDKGSALVGILEKKGENSPILFADVDGTIIDCSPELLETLDLDLTSTNINNRIQDVAPELERVNNAFNSIYLPQIPVVTPSENIFSLENEGDNGPYLSSKVSKAFSPRRRSSWLSSEAFPILQERKFASPRNGFHDASQRGFLTSTSQEDRKFNKTREHLKKSFLGLPLVEEELKIPSGAPAKEVYQTLKSENSEDELDEDARRNHNIKICEEFKNGSFVLFRSKSQVGGSNGMWARYFITVDHFVFDQQLYKAVKMRRVGRKNRAHQGTLVTKLALQNQTQVDSGLFDGKLGRRRLRRKETQSQEKYQDKSSLNQVYLTLNKLPKSQYTSANQVEEDANQSSKGELSLDSHYTKSKKISEVLQKIFSRDKTTSLRRIYFMVFYFAMILVLVIAAIGLSVTRSSFDQIETALELVNTDSQRLTSLIKLWGTMNVIYHFTKKHEEIPAQDEFYSFINSQTQKVKQANRDLTTLLSSIDSKEVLNEFYKKNIHLYSVDDDNEQVEPLSFDFFMASNIVVDKFRLIANESQYTLSTDEKSLIFLMNNTANDIILSAEKELEITEETKNKIYSDNIFFLKANVIYQILSVIIVSFSLVMLAVKILKAYQKMFRVLLTISPQHIETRKQQLDYFQQLLKGKTEDMIFVENFNSLLEERVQNKKVVNPKAIGFREEKKLNFFKLLIKGGFLLIFAFSLFVLIFVLFYWSNDASISNLDKLRNIDDNISISTKFARYTYLVNGNLMSFMSFYSKYDDILLRNEKLEDQLVQNLETILTINQQLTSNFRDSTIKHLLSGGLCAFLKQQLPLNLQLCASATKGDVIGLLGLNIQYHDQSYSFAEEFKREFAVTSESSLIRDYFYQSLPFISTLEAASNFLITYLLGNLADMIEKQRANSKVFFSVLFVVGICVTFLVRILTIEKLVAFDRKRHKILNIIPQAILLENKAITFYIKREFSDEISEIKSIL